MEAISSISSAAISSHPHLPFNKHPAKTSRKPESLLASHLRNLRDQRFDEEPFENYVRSSPLDSRIRLPPSDGFLSNMRMPGILHLNFSSCSRETIQSMDTMKTECSGNSGNGIPNFRSDSPLHQPDEEVPVQRDDPSEIWFNCGDNDNDRIDNGKENFAMEISPKTSECRTGEKVRLDSEMDWEDDVAKLKKPVKSVMNTKVGMRNRCGRHKWILKDIWFRKAEWLRGLYRSSLSMHAIRMYFKRQKKHEISLFLKKKSCETKCIRRTSEKNHLPVRKVTDVVQEEGNQKILQNDFRQFHLHPPKGEAALEMLKDITRLYNLRGGHFKTLCRVFSNTLQ